MLPHAWNVPAILALTLLLGAGGANANDDAEEVDVLKQLGLPGMARAHIKTMVERGIPLSVEAKVRGTDKAPAKGAKLELRWKGGSKTLTTGDAGSVTFGVTAEMLPSPKLVVPAGHRVTLSTPLMRISVATGSGASGPGAPAPEVLDLDALERMTHDGLEVYHPEGREAVALDAMQFLARVRGYLDGRLGLEVETPFGLALHDRTAPRVNVIGRSVFPFSIKAWKGDTERPGMVHWVQIHEWVELTLVTPGLYVQDKQTRYVGDGLAELLSYEYCRRHHAHEVPVRLKQYVERVDALLKAGKTTYDLRRDFQAHVQTRTLTGAEAADWRRRRLAGGVRPSLNEVAGYALAFLYWHRIQQQGGDEALRQVVAWIVKPDNPARNGTGLTTHLTSVLGEAPSPVIDLTEARAALASLLAKATH
ncbi:MAG: hypothetical protein QNJ98_06730 [Planctomycetota bacterium]|nr:hypothetical protein [Planctomycetota bacterium]